MSEPRSISVSDGGLDPDTLSDIVEHVRNQGLLAYPTETVYGFGGLAEPAALSRLERLKPRHGKQGYLLLLPAADAVPGLAWTRVARSLAQAFWPGPLTLVLRDPACLFPLPARSPEGTVAVRVSPHPLARAVVEALGAPLTSTSANVPGTPPAATGAEALEVGRALGAGSELWVLDQGRLPPQPSSTILDVSGPIPRLRRAGALDLKRIHEILPEIDERAD